MIALKTVPKEKLKNHFGKNGISESDYIFLIGHAYLDIYIWLCL